MKMVMPMRIMKLKSRIIEIIIKKLNADEVKELRAKFSEETDNIILKEYISELIYGNKKYDVIYKLSDENLHF